MDDRNTVLECRCVEPEGTFVRTVRRCELSLEKLGYLYEQVKDFELVFNDFVNNDLREFVQVFIGETENGQIFPKGMIWEVDDVGILYLTEIRPSTALAHYTFWDRRIRGREQLIRRMLKHCFEAYGFRRIEAEVGLYAPRALSAVERIGFVKEGRKRAATPYRGEWFDLNIYSILATEIDGLILNDGED